MTVKEMLKANPKTLITIDRSTNILKAMKLLIDNKISSLPVVTEDNKLIGIVSDKDIFKAVYNNQTGFVNSNVSEFMSTELIVGVEKDKIDYISGMMTKNRIRHIPIVEGERLIGLISIGDIVKVRQDDIEVENRYLKQYIHGNFVI